MEEIFATHWYKASPVRQDANVGFLVIGHDTDRGGMSSVAARHASPFVSEMLWWKRHKWYRDIGDGLEFPRNFPSFLLFSCVLRSLGSKSL